MKFKRIIALLISAMLCLSLVACGETETPEKTEQTTANTTESVSDSYLSLYDGETGVNVIYSPDANENTLNIASKLARSLTKMGTADVSAKPASATPDSSKTEVLVANVGYDESKRAYSTLGYGEAKACVVANKVVIAGFDVTSLEKAVDLFLHAIADAKDENGGLRIARDYSETAITNEMVAALPVMEGIVPHSITHTGDECYMLTFKSMEKASVDKYLKAIEENDYTLHAQNSIENNSFYTYKNSTQVITAIYTANTQTARILVEPISNADLDVLKENTDYTRGDKDITFTQLGLAYADGENAAEYYTSGMSYVMRLDDGSFIVIDGGYDKQGDADRLYELMKAQSDGEENVTVAAWIFTHAHSDHVEVLPKLARSYSDKVTVERFIYNFPSNEQKSGLSDSASKVISALDGYYEDVPRIKAHAGQKFYIRSAVIEMLYTLEIYDYTLSSYNLASLVFTISTEGKQIMMLGDYYLSDATLRNLYTEETLKSDIMQVAHHGISDGSNTMNAMIAPEYAFWPVASLQLKSYWEDTPEDVDLTAYAFNDYFTKTMSEDKVFVASDDVSVMTLSGGISVSIYDSFDDYLQGTVKE